MLYKYMFTNRKKLLHGIPAWVSDGSEYFITICAEPRGINQHCQLDLAEVVRQAFQFYQERGALWAHLLLLMPDHLHAIVSFAREPGMQKTIREIKKYTARNHGIKWQRDFFDHRLRHDESYIEKAHYIRMNPVRAGLIDQPEDWPYMWENRTW